MKSPQLYFYTNFWWLARDLRAGVFDPGNVSIPESRSISILTADANLGGVEGATDSSPGNSKNEVRVAVATPRDATPYLHIPLDAEVVEPSGSRATSGPNKADWWATRQAIPIRDWTSISFYTNDRDDLEALAERIRGFEYVGIDRLLNLLLRGEGEVSESLKRMLEREPTVLPEDELAWPLYSAYLDGAQYYAKKQEAGSIMPKATPADVKRLESLKNDPIVLRYTNAMRAAHGSGLEYRNRRPWEALAEKKAMAAYFYHLGAHGDGISFGSLMSQELVDQRRRAAKGFALAILEAKTYLWLEEMERAACSAPLPRHIVSPVIAPDDMMFWSRETANENQTGQDWWLIVNNRPGGPPVQNATTLAVPEEGDYFLSCVTNVVDTTGGRLNSIELYTVIIQYGAVYPDDFIERDDFNLVTSILQKMAFLNSRYVQQTKHTSHDFPREIRREYDRKRIMLTDEEISVVTLRRPTPKLGREHSDTLDSAIEWQHQWWVSGHNHAYWVGEGRTEQIVKWIAPFIKGPPDKPFKERVYRVAR